MYNSKLFKYAIALAVVMVIVYMAIMIKMEWDKRNAAVVSANMKVIETGNKYPNQVKVEGGAQTQTAQAQNREMSTL